MSGILKESDMYLIAQVISDTLHVPRHNNRCLYKYKSQLENLLNLLMSTRNENEKLLSIWEKEKKFAEEWNIDMPEPPILKNIKLSNEDIEIIKEAFQEITKEYPTDDLLSTYIGGDIKTFDLDNFGPINKK